MESKVVSVQTQNNLSVVQFISSNIDTFDYVSLGKAINENLIEMKELGEGASVNDIIVFNNSNKYVFMMDGDIIQGAKQNRIINTSILIAPNTKSKIKVSCVEQGRWHHVSSKFSASGLNAPTFMRAEKNRDVFDNLKKNKEHYADQTKVWDNVSSYAKKFNVDSATNDLNELFCKKMENEKDPVSEFKCSESTNGLALFNGNKFLSLDLFNRADVYREYFPKIIRGAFLEFQYLKGQKQNINEEEVKYKTLEVLDKTETIEKNTFDGIGVGTEKRFDKTNLIGLELFYNNLLIHQSVIKTGG